MDAMDVLGFDFNLYVPVDKDDIAHFTEEQVVELRDRFYIVAVQHRVISCIITIMGINGDTDANGYTMYKYTWRGDRYCILSDAKHMWVYCELAGNDFVVHELFSTHRRHFTPGAWLHGLLEQCKQATDGHPMLQKWCVKEASQENK